MYIESEFMLLEANNEKLARENERLAEALEEIANSETAYYMIDIAKQALMPEEERWPAPHLGMEAKLYVNKGFKPTAYDAQLPECTCLPDLVEGES